MINFDIDVKFDKTDIVLKNHGFQEGGPVQAFFTSEVMENSGPYTPGGSDGMLATNTTIWKDKDGYTYISIYSKNMWGGKVMVDPITGKGGFFSESYGFWSRPKTPKILSNRDIKYHGGPLEGPRWVDRMWADRSDTIIDSVQKFSDRGAK